MSRITENAAKLFRRQQEPDPEPSPVADELIDVTIEEPLLALMTLRVEKRIGPSGVQWRAILHTSDPQNNLQADTTTDWKEWRWFAGDFAMLNRPMTDFLMGSKARPRIEGFDKTVTAK